MIPIAELFQDLFLRVREVWVVDLELVDIYPGFRESSSGETFAPMGVVKEERSRDLHLLVDHRQNRGTRLPIPSQSFFEVATRHAGSVLLVNVLMTGKMVGDLQHLEMGSKRMLDFFGLEVKTTWSS